jgi:hypothetical protein
MQLISNLWASLTIHRIELNPRRVGEGGRYIKEIGYICEVSQNKHPY